MTTKWAQRVATFAHGRAPNSTSHTRGVRICSTHHLRPSLHIVRGKNESEKETY